MDDFDSRSSMFMFRALAGPLTSVLSVMLVTMLFAPVALYVIARWRSHRAPVADPHLGLKFVLHFFTTSAFHLALAGGALLVWTMISPGPSAGKGELYRLAFGFLVPAGLILGLHIMLLKRTNDEQFTGVRRLFVGYNLLIVGMIAFGALVMGFQILFAKGGSDGKGHLAGSVVLVYGTAWALLGFRFGQLVLDGTGFGSSGDGGMPDVVAPPPPQMPPATAAGGGLPSLGGGSFPPIDQK